MLPFQTISSDKFRQRSYRPASSTGSKLSSNWFEKNNKINSNQKKQSLNSKHYPNSFTLEELLIKRNNNATLKIHKSKSSEKKCKKNDISIELPKKKYY